MNYLKEYLNKPGIVYAYHGQFSADLPARAADDKLLWGIEKDPLVPCPKARRYELSRFELLFRYTLAHPDISFARLVHFAAIPNGKFDLNASGPFSIDYVGGNTGYCQGAYAERERIY